MQGPTGCWAPTPVVALCCWRSRPPQLLEPLSGTISAATQCAALSLSLPSSQCQMRSLGLAGRPCSAYQDPGWNSPGSSVLCSPLQQWCCTPTACPSTPRLLSATPGWSRYTFPVSVCLVCVSVPLAVTFRHRGLHADGVQLELGAPREFLGASATSSLPSTPQGDNPLLLVFLVLSIPWEVR